MRHKLGTRENLGNSQWTVVVELLPDNEAETNAIKNVQNLSATETEWALVDNYLNFSLGIANYSPIETLSQEGAFFYLKIFIG